jgi:hypothetical protein
MPNNILLYPPANFGGGGGPPPPPGTDIYGPTRIVSNVVSEGTDTTIASALTALAATGGYIQLKPGTFTIGTTNTMPDKSIVIRGSGNNTIISLGASAIPAFTIPNGLTAERNYVFEDFLVTGTSVANQKVWSIEDVNSHGVVNATRVNSTGVQFPLHITAGGSTEPTLVVLDDCHFVPIAAGTGILVNTPNGAGITANVYMHSVRFYNVFEDAVTGALTGGGFFSDFTGVNIIGEDNLFAIGTGGTMGAISLADSTIYNFGPNANPIIAVADDNFGLISSNLVEYNGAFVNFNFAGNGTHVYGGFYRACSFTDGAISFFTDVYTFGNLVAPDTAVIIGSSDTFIKGCYFDNHGTAFVLDGNFNTITGNRFNSSGTGITAMIRTTNGTVAISDNRMESNVVPSLLEAGGTAKNRINNNKFLTAPTLLANTQSSVDERNVRTVTGNTTLDITHETVLVDATAGNLTMTLPLSAAAPFKRYNIKKIDATANTVTIDGNGTEKIDNALVQVIATQYASLSPESDGINAWWII